MDKHCTIGAVAAVAACIGMSIAGGVASAATFNVGGATLPQRLYEEEFATPPNDQHTWNYGEVGSRHGRAAFLLNDSTRLSLPLGGKVHFGTSETPMTATEYSSYTSVFGLGNLGASTGHGRLIQIPLAVTPVMIYAKSLSQAVTQSSFASLTKSQLCGVFSGAINRWSQLNPAFPNRPFKVIVRLEPSGPTSLLTRHLQAVCTSGETGGMTFNGNEQFRMNFPNGELPPNFVEVLKDQGVSDALNMGIPPDALPEAMTYLSPDPAYVPIGSAYALRLRNRNNSMDYDGWSTTAVMLGIGSALSAPSGPLVTDPTVAGYTSATNPGYPPNWVKEISDPVQGYPIVGTTNLILSQCYADARLPGQLTLTETALRMFVNDHYANTMRILSHAMVPLPSAYMDAIRQTFFTGVRWNGQLAMGGAYCASVVGR
ncbi:Phosphate-binding protein [Bordetella ansorpii]|uniref:Phosphate-binding protein n=1 Tax=Bordetella ansorpii TaxID=288768 RepID=A0A157QK99_9BORD|nr:substrate-binding domain-containing protein [Bordetella ansorpii]SAI46323.1 Phosphate-binding protein [Bordetella ansorpii]